MSPESSPPPSPPVRQLSTQLSSSSTPPDIKPRVSSRSVPAANAVKQPSPIPIGTPNKALPCSPVRSTNNAQAGKSAPPPPPPEWDGHASTRTRSYRLFLSFLPFAEPVNIRSHSVDAVDRHRRSGKFPNRISFTNVSPLADFAGGFGSAMFRSLCVKPLS